MDKLLEDGADTGEVKTAVYKRRWWVLFVYSLFSFLQGMIWAVPGPISQNLEQLIPLDDTAIQLLVNWGPIFYLPFAAPFAWWMDRPGGIRPSVIFSILLVTVGQVLHCVARDGSNTSVYLTHVGYILNAIAGPVSMGAVGKISEAWFPVHERATATALMSEANLLGGAGAFVIGPYMMPDPSWSQYLSYMYLLVGLCGLNLVCSLVYFPAHPPLPPSISAQGVKDGEDAFTLVTLWSSVKKLMRNRSFMVLIWAYGLSTGMYGSWATVMSINLAGFGYDAQQAGWIGFAASVAGNVGGIALGRWVDKFRNLKRLLVVLMALAAICFTLFAIVCSPHILPPQWTGGSSDGLALLFALAALGGLFLNSTIPLYYELALDVTYPIPEGTSVIVMTIMNNVGCLIFLGVPVGQYGTAWMNWLFGGTIALFAVALALGFDERSLRYDMDTGKADADAVAEQLEHEADGGVAAYKGDAQRLLSGIGIN